MPASDHSATEHDRLREAIGDIKDDAKETRDSVRSLGRTMSDLKDVIMGWKGEVELRLADVVARLKVLEEWHTTAKSSKTERVNAALNAVTIALVLWLLYKVTGIKTP
jgi:hypothetical protein